MRRVGGGSWRMSIGDTCNLLHTATFVRDAYRLRLSEDPFLPPPLEGDLPDLSSGLDPDLREAAERQWRAWWQEIYALYAPHILRGRGLA